MYMGLLMRICNQFVANQLWRVQLRAMLIPYLYSQINKVMYN